MLRWYSSERRLSGSLKSKKMNTPRKERNENEASANKAMFNGHETHGIVPKQIRINGTTATKRGHIIELLTVLIRASVARSKPKGRPR